MAERGEYRSISRSLFSGKDFRRLPERPRWIFTVLKMNSGMVGLDTWYEAELYSRLSEESGATIDQVKLALDFLEHERWIRREDNVVWVVGHLVHDPHMKHSNTNHRKSVQRHVAGLPHLAIVKAFIAENSDWFPKTEAIEMGCGWVWDTIRRGSGRVKRGANKVSEGHSDHDKEKKDDKEKEIPDSGESEGEKISGPKLLELYPVAVCESLRQKWEAQGRSCEYPRFRKATKQLFIPGPPRYSEDQLAAAIEAFDELAKSDGPMRSSFWHLQRFVDNVGEYVEWAAQPTVNPETRQLTARGRMALGV